MSDLNEDQFGHVIASRLKTTVIKGDEMTTMHHAPGRPQRITHHRFQEWSRDEEGVRTGVWMIDQDKPQNY